MGEQTKHGVQKEDDLGIPRLASEECGVNNNKSKITENKSNTPEQIKRPLPKINLRMDIKDKDDVKKEKGNNNKKEGASNDDYKDFRGPIRDKVNWTDKELEALIEGLEKHRGQKRWTEILNENADIFHPERRIVDLVDKYRQYSKSSSFYLTEKKDWIEMDEDGEPRTDSMGEIVCFNEKFPYDAALKFAKREKNDRKENSIITIRELENELNTHSYNVFVESNSVKLKKVILKEDD